MPNPSHAPTPIDTSAPSRREFLHSAAAMICIVDSLAQASAQKASTRTTVFYDPAVMRHEPGGDHPESPKRLTSVMSVVRALESRGRVAIATPAPATEAQIARVHTPQYFNKVRAEVAAGQRTLSTGDTELSSGSFAAALAAAGTVVSAVDAVIGGRSANAFCACRPPGHHASASRGMGFCLFNNIAIGARHATLQHGVDRILIVDWDVHHGNGTQEVFWSDGSVLFFDTHQHPWYPGTGLSQESGEGKGRGLIINRPFPSGAGRREILGAMRETLIPAAERFKPQLVMISAGFDSRAGDPLGELTLTDQDFADLTNVVAAIARDHAGGRLISVLEGGYALDGLARAVDAHLSRLSV